MRWECVLDPIRIQEHSTSASSTDNGGKVSVKKKKGKNVCVRAR